MSGSPLNRSHDIPPAKGVGELQSRVRLRNPGPQSALHSDHEDHDPHPPLAARDGQGKDDHRDKSYLVRQ